MEPGSIYSQSKVGITYASQQSRHIEYRSNQPTYAFVEMSYGVPTWQGCLETDTRCLVSVLLYVIYRRIFLKRGKGPLTLSGYVRMARL